MRDVAICATLAISNSRFLNPQGTLQAFEFFAVPTAKFYNFKDWGIPAGATADIAQNEPAATFSPGLAGQLIRCFGRCVWPKEAQGHIKPRAPEQGAYRLYNFVTKASFPSAQREGYRAAIFLRLTGWSSGSRRRRNDERKLYMSSGDVFGLFNAHSLSLLKTPTSNLSSKPRKLRDKILSLS